MVNSEVGRIFKECYLMFEEIYKERPE